MPRLFLRLLLLAVPLLVLGAVLLPGRFLDTAGEGAGLPAGDLVDAVAMARAVRAGSLPTWEPRYGLGAPLAATADLGAWYPPNLVYLVGDAEVARGWLAFASLVLGGLGVALLCERRGLKPLAALVGAAAFQVVAVRAASEGRALLEGAAWLPWCFWAHAGLREGRRAAGPLLAMTLGLVWLASPPTVGVNATLALVVVERVTRARGEPPFPWNASSWVALGVLAGAVRWVPRAFLGVPDVLELPVGPLVLPASAFGVALTFLALLSIASRPNGVWLVLAGALCVPIGAYELATLIFGWLVAAGADTVLRRVGEPFGARGVRLASVGVLALAAIGVAEDVVRMPALVATVPRLPASPPPSLVAAAGDGRVARDQPLASDHAREGAALGLSELSADRASGTPHASELLSALVPPHVEGADPLPLSVDHPLLDLAYVRAVCSDRPLRHALLHEVPGLEGVYEREARFGPVRVVPRLVVLDDDASVLETLRSASIDPRDAALVPERPDAVPLPPSGGFEPGTLTVDRPAQHRVDVGVRGSSGGWLVFHAAWAPGWKATVNGADAEVRRVDHALRAVRIPAGDAVVRTKYEPWSLRVGASLTVLALALALVAGLRAWRGRRRALPSLDALPGPLER